MLTNINKCSKNNERERKTKYKQHTRKSIENNGVRMEITTKITKYLEKCLNKNIIYLTLWLFSLCLEKKYQF